jgi:D-methionine transport system ATP-binding protein
MPSKVIDNSKVRDIIRFDEVVKHFGEVRAVDGVSFSIKAGEIFGVIGHSGAGKSTLVRLVNAIERVSSGSIIVDEWLVGDNTPNGILRELRRNVGMIFQQFNLLSSRNVYKNIEYPLKINGVPAEERKQRVAELLDFVGLTDKAEVYPSQLSGGQKQRVGIARALATNPKILLADEATSALDPETTLDILRLLRQVNREFGTTILIITHTMSVVKLICERVAVMDDGKVVEIGETKQIFEHPEHPTTKRFINVLETLETGNLDLEVND